MQSSLDMNGNLAWKRFFARWGGWSIFGLVVLVAVTWGYLANPRVTEAVLASTVRQATPLVWW